MFLKERWGKAFCEDTMLFEVLRKQGLKVAFVPSLMMVNREACDVPGYSSWVRRQLLTARLYHPRWLAVAGHGLMTSLVQAAAVVLLVAALVTGRGEVAAWVGGGLAVYLASMVAMRTTNYLNSFSIFFTPLGSEKITILSCALICESPTAIKLSSPRIIPPIIASLGKPTSFTGFFVMGEFG